MICRSSATGMPPPCSGKTILLMAFVGTCEPHVRADLVRYCHPDIEMLK